MLRLGEKQSLTVVKKVEFGVYLAEDPQLPEAEMEKVLLPVRQVPEGTGVGDVLEVFLYRDSEDRLIATTREPLLTIGKIARLTVREVGRVGAFLDWGLEKDLLLPFGEQTVRVARGDSVLAALYLDRSGRLCATMNIYEYLDAKAPYAKDATVTGTVYLLSEKFGAFVAVDDRYSALVPRQEMYGAAENLRVNRPITARVSRVLPDGRLELSVRDKGYLQREADAEKLLGLIGGHGGRLPFTDKAAPELILRETGMSKAQFKRAVGKLLKDGRVSIEADGIALNG